VCLRRCFTPWRLSAIVVARIRDVADPGNAIRYDPKEHQRRSIRLRDYDYAQTGAYFVTVCTEGRQCLFGQVEDGTVRLNGWGRIVHETWSDLPNHYPHVELDAFVIMPNHVHMVVVLADPVGAGFKPAPTKRHGLPEIMRAFKTFSSRRINERRATPGASLWQRNYYEHIIRNAESLNRIRQYIADNPASWAFDQENSQGKSTA
jgi:putative transposase